MRNSITAINIKIRKEVNLAEIFWWQSNSDDSFLNPTEKLMRKIGYEVPTKVDKLMQKIGYDSK